MISFSCPSCLSPFKVEDDLAGRKTKCPKCKTSLFVPEPKAAPTAPTDWDEAADSKPAKARPPRERQTAIIVNANVRGQGSNSLGITSLILGLVALPISFVPIIGVVGFLIAALAALLGLIAVIVSSRRGGYGIGFGVGGVAVSLLALAVSGTITWALIKPSVDKVKEAAKRAEEKNLGTSDAGRTPDTKAVPVAKKIKRSAVPFNITADGIEIEILSVEVAPIEVRGFGDATTKSDDSHTKIRLRVTSKTEGKKVDFESFSGGSFERRSWLGDDRGNDYKRVSFGALNGIVGQARKGSLYPNKPIEDMVVFEALVPGWKILRLKLSKESFGGKEDLEVEIEPNAAR